MEEEGWEEVEDGVDIKLRERSYNVKRVERRDIQHSIIIRTRFEVTFSGFISCIASSALTIVFDQSLKTEHH